MAALVLLGSASCEQKPATVTPEDATPDSAAPARTEPLGDTSAAYGGHDAEGLDATAPRKRPLPEAVESKDAALQAVTHGNPEGGRDFLKGFVAEHPDDAAARHALARAHLLLGETEAVRAVLSKDVGSDVLGTRLVAESYVREGKLDEAKDTLLRASAKLPNAMPLRGDLVTVLVAQGKRDDPAARKLMDGLYDDYEGDRAKTAADLFAVAQAALGRGSKGALHDANMVFGEAEELAATNDPDGWDLEAIVLRRANMFREKYAAEDALQTYALILEGRDPWNPDALAGSARVHVDNLAFALASRLAEEALQVDPANPDAHAVLARIALIEGRREEALERIETHVLARNPNHTSGLAVMAALALVQGDDAAYTKWRDAALASNPHNGTYYNELADVLGFLHLYPETEVILVDGQTRAPKDPAVSAARGLNLLRLGKEKEARTLLEEAWARDPFNERTRNTLDLYDERIDKHYSERKVGDLVVRLPNEDRELIEPVLVDAVRTSRDALDAAYHVKAGELRLEFFADPNDFSIRTVGVPSLGAVAVCFGPVITFIGPYMGRFNIDNVVRHELGHVYAIRLSKGRVPRWFTEGLSEWESELADPAYARESAQLLVAARRAGKLRRLGELELAFIRAESPQMMEVAYSTAAYAVRYLGNTYGRDKLIAMLKGYGEGKHTDELMQAHLGKPLSEVERDFEAWFFGQLGGVFSGWQPSSDPEEADERDALFQRAIGAMEQNNRDAARAALEELIGRDGDGFVPRMMLAKLAESGTSSVATRKHLEAARGFNRESVEPLVMLANLAREEDRTDDEKRLLLDALAIDGDAFEPAGRLLMLGLVTADTKATETALRRARSIAPLHPIVLAGEAIVAQKKGQTARAKELAQAAAKRLEGAEGPADTFVAAALASSEAGDAATAKLLAKRALELGGIPRAAKTRIETLAQ